MNLNKLIYLISCYLFFIPVKLNAQDPDWENPLKPSLNVVHPHAWFIPNKPLMQSLDGLWRFNWSKILH
ncbi:hypothetical protein [Pedobacter sp. NJ-S-72]